MDESVTPVGPEIDLLFAVYDNTGRMLLALHVDGTVEGAVEDASEAGRRFVEAIRLDWPEKVRQSLVVTGKETASDG